MPHTLYVIPSSHPCVAVETAFKMKGIPYRRVDRLPLVAKLQGRMSYGGATVPGVRLENGEKLFGSTTIMRRLDALAPEPPLYPEGAEARAAADAAEAWGDVEFQGTVRRILDGGFVRAPLSGESYLEGAKLPVPTALARPTLPLTMKLLSRTAGASDERVQADLAALPATLDRIDGWIRDGVLGAGPTASAADLQIAASLALLYSIEDVRPAIDGRPALKLLDYVPRAVGVIPAGTLPAAWLPARAPAAAN